MIQPTNKNYQKLVSLFQQDSSLFEKINIDEYLDEDGEGQEILYRDGESDLIEINNQTWRFSWESVEEFGIEENA
nr:hypothetical protein [Nostoc sp. SerVER01]